MLLADTHTLLHTTHELMMLVPAHTGADDAAAAGTHAADAALAEWLRTVELSGDAWDEPSSLQLSYLLSRDGSCLSQEQVEARLLAADRLVFTNSFDSRAGEWLGCKLSPMGCVTPALVALVCLRVPRLLHVCLCCLYAYILSLREWGRRPSPRTSSSSASASATTRSASLAVAATVTVATVAAVAAAAGYQRGRHAHNRPHCHRRRRRWGGQLLAAATATTTAAAAAVADATTVAATTVAASGRL